MEQFVAISKKCGGSLKIIIPSEIVKKKNIKLNKKYTFLIFKINKDK